MARSAAVKKDSPAFEVRGGATVQKTGDLERLIHEPVRLAIVSALAANDSLTFKELRDLLELTDGNLSVHARKLEDADYVSFKKTFEGRVPKTTYRLTPKGRAALQKYLDHMEAIVRAMRGELER